MKRFFVALFVAVLLWGCTSNLEIVKNWKEVVKERAIEEKPKIVANVGDVLFQKHIDDVYRYDCFKNDVPIFFPDDLIEDLELQPGYFIPAGKSFCSISTYDCNLGEFYLEIEKRVTKEENGNDWCSSEDSIPSIQWIYLKISAEKEGNSILITKSDELVLRETRTGYRYLKKEYELPNNIKLSSVVKDTINYNVYYMELIFGGVQGNSLIMYFREYYRSELNQPHSYTLYYNVEDIKRQGKIKFRDVELEVIDFDGQSITYRIAK
ncbi:MAG: hypothetical protein CH6_2559 [Candidatus Kapaibacterium sp.]|nr:MAG: hypothetical protein CH6_2559 [Candidatus Kapabacteria bacterium]